MTAVVHHGLRQNGVCQRPRIVTVDPTKNVEVSGLSGREYVMPGPPYLQIASTRRLPGGLDQELQRAEPVEKGEGDPV